MDTIELVHVSRWYGPVIGLNDVSLTIRGGVTGLLGPNGAGKSTLIRLVTGQIAPSLGTVRVFGQPTFQNCNILSRVGYCPDIERFNDDLTGFAFLRSAAYLSGYGMADASVRARELLERVGLADVGDRRIGGYSKGMRARVKLAQSLVADPDLLVFDEPLTGMDPLVRRQVIDLVRSLGDDGRTVLASSHVLHEVEAMTDSVILIHHGRVLAQGRVREIRGLLSGYPHHVTVEVDEPRRVASRLVADVELDGVRIGRSELTLETRVPAKLFARLEAMVLDERVDIKRLYTRDDSLDAVFDYLVQ